MAFTYLLSKKIISTKKGDRMAFVQLEDMEQTAEIIIFPKLFAKIEPWLSTHAIFIVKGNVDVSSNGICKIKAQECMPIEYIFDQWHSFQQAVLMLPEPHHPRFIELLKQISPGKIPLTLQYKDNNKLMKLVTKKQIALSFELLDILSEAGFSGTIYL